jgi:hypothetical protein
MRTKNKILKWLIVVGGIILVQTLTFYLVSERQLKAKLLPEYFQFAHESDSAFVRGFYEPSEDPPLSIIRSHDLKSDSSLLKTRLRVKFVLFAEHSSQKDQREDLFNLVYYTWVERADWFTLFNFYKMTQVEKIMIDKKRTYKREVTYQWFLFFWIKSFEFIESDDLTIDG